MSVTTSINIGMHIHEVTEPPSPEQHRVKLNQQQRKLNQQRATLVGKQ